jgi:quercetin dioxygenase-like cupin family protein
MSNTAKARCILPFSTGALLLLCLRLQVASAEDYATNKAPLAFGPDQTIIDLNKVVEWGPLELAGFPPGAEIVVLRGALAHGSELLVRVPAGYLIPNHNHTSDETYIFLRGDFTYINGGDGQSAKMSGQSFISLPGNAPPHAIRCESAACLFYLRYSRPFDHKVYAMPEKLVPLE